MAGLNETDGDIKVPQHSAPTRKDGILRPEHYNATSTHMPLNFDPFPDLDKAAMSLASTRAPEFTPAVREKGEALPKYLMRMAKTYMGFYKTGLKNLWANRKEMKEVQGWIFPFTFPGVARFGGNMYKNKQGNMIPIPHIHRREFQLYHRTKADMRKMLPFGLVLAICWEFTPIALLVLGRRVVPKVCLLPFQQREEMDDAVKRFKNWKKEMSRLTATSLVEKPRHTFDFAPKNDLLEHVYLRDWLMGYLVGQTNIKRWRFPLSRGLYWHLILKPRLSAFWENTFCDTILIQRQGGFATLSPQDIYEYARNYGLLTLLVIMEREIGRKNYDFVNESLKKRLLPVLEEEARIILDDDFTKLSPHLHWARAYRDTARWAMGPDAVEAAKLVKAFERMDAAEAEATRADFSSKRKPTAPTVGSIEDDSKPPSPMS